MHIHSSSLCCLFFLTLSTIYKILFVRSIALPQSKANFAFQQAFAIRISLSFVMAVLVLF